MESPSCVTGGDGAFLLIRVIFPWRNDRSGFSDVFIYTAGPGLPSLQLLPRPYPVGFLTNRVGVLSCGDTYSNHYCLVVLPERRFVARGRVNYNLHVFSDRTRSWSVKAARLACDAQEFYGDFVPTKVFSVDGGSLAWVDLRIGILLFNSLPEDPEVRLIRLPPLLPTNYYNIGEGFDGILPQLDSIRDVTCRNGWFWFIEMEFPELDDDDDNAQFNHHWTATIFKRMICSDEWDWEPLCTVDSASLSPADSCFPCLFPEIWDCKENKLTLSNVISSAPTLDMYRDDVIYMIAKMKGDDPNGWVLVVNTKSEKLEKVSPFSAERLYYHRTHLQCSFSNYLRR
ncbi:hypothetical protein PR202_ga19164 [Eleusine coracana subsp. coracana]|uniref:DUF1618 domain-containing protein n=1 Tax=Eleusine coracana subsp. coracana TaxID=191504 RepID=A0AAV5CUW6_ELECO|nr:hypothetical protein PR202_ga19164 [Eleusine coracana subsp. coracana]